MTRWTALLCLLAAVSGCGEETRVSPAPAPTPSLDNPDATPPAPVVTPAPPPAAPADFRALPTDTLDGPDFADFVDVAVCAQCHAQRHETWADSTHGRAGGPPSPKTIVAPFDGRPLRFTDATVWPERRGKRYAFRIQAMGRPEEVRRVDAVVGAALIHGGGAQTYFEAQDDGRLLNLPFEWSRDAKAWFCQTKDRTWRPIDGRYALGDCDWPPSRTLGTGPGKTCQNCHASQLRLLFDENARRYETQYSSLAIDCQACHGPGRKHVEWAKGGAKGADIGLEPLGLLDREASVEVCMRCHANKQQAATGYLPGDDFAAHYALAAIRPPSDPKIRPDGHLTGFGYQQAHLYSPCYLDGSMTCVDCHDPHDLSYRDVHGRRLEGRFDDGQCVGCHPAKEGQAHSGHQNTRCTDCHMRLRQHGGIGQEIRLARADHAITIPRSEVESQVGTACADCHPNQSTAAGLTRLYGELKPLPPLVEALLNQDPNLEAVIDGLAALGKDAPLTVSAGVTALLSDHLPKGRSLSPRVSTLLRRLAGADRVEVRAVALTGLLVLGGEPERAFAYESVKTAGPSRAALRNLVAHNLMAVDFAFARISPAVAARMRGLLIDVALPLALDPTLAYPIVGSAFASAGDWARALALYDRAIAWPAPADGKRPLGLAGPPAQLLGMRGNALLTMNRVPEALATYRRAVQAFPHDPANTDGLCRLLVRTRAYGEAIDCLKAFLALVPDDSETRLVRAELLEAAARYPEALAEAKRALATAPRSPRAAALVGRLERRGAK